MLHTTRVLMHRPTYHYMLPLADKKGIPDMVLGGAFVSAVLVVIAVAVG
jgi:hypothetical protein